MRQKEFFELAKILLIVIFLLESITISTFAQDNVPTDNVFEQNEDISKYCNPEYEEYLNSIEDLPQDEYNSKINVAPSQYSYNEIYVQGNDEVAPIASTYDAQYDNLTGLNLKFYNIDAYPSSGEIGWSFGATNTLEMYMKKRKNLKDFSLSPINLLKGISSEYVDENYAMTDTTYTYGDFSMASAYWMTNRHTIGNAYTITDTVNLSDLNRFSDDTSVNDRIDSIKRMVMYNGGVYANLEIFTGAFDPNYSSYNNNDGGEIQSGRTIESGITIVGWDDNYAIDKFGASKPKRQGAFKVITNRTVETNNGTVNLGSYYIAYDMVKFMHDISSVQKVETDNYDTYTYEYDKKAHKGVTNSNSTQNVYANKYINSTGSYHTIKSITTYCEVPNSYFNVYISTDGTMSGLQKVDLYGSNTSGYHATNMGYITMELRTGCDISGDFIVAIQVTTPYTSAPSIPQEIRPVNNPAIKDRCFISDSITSLKTGSYTDCGSENNIIKVHVTNAKNREWRFDDSSFDGVKNSIIQEKTTVHGLEINKLIEFNNSSKSFKGIKLNNYALLRKSTTYDEKSLSFSVSGRSKIYLMAKSNSEVDTRRIAIYSTNTEKTDYINVSASNGYRYSYEGGAGEIYLYSVDNSVRIYEIAVEDYNEDDWCPIDSYENTVWDFEDLVEQGTITSHITYTENYNTMDVYASSEKPVRVIKNTSTTKDGYRYFQVLNLDGTGSDTYRTLAFNVHMESTIYITAKAESGTELYITNKYACPLDTDLGGDILNLTSEYVTYKINYNGYGEKVYIRSKDNNIRIAQIAVTAHDLYGADEHDFNPSNEEQLTIGEVITDKSVNGYHILSVESRPATVVATTEAGYTKALELTSGEHMKNMARISFEIGDSRGTSNTNPKRAIRIKAKANTTGLNLVLGNEYGYIIDIKPMSTTLDEYIFDYSDYKDKLYLFAFGSTHSTVELYSISKTDTDYYTEVTPIILRRDNNGQGICMITANNMPNVGTYTLQLKYNTNELTYVGFDNISNAFNSAIASESANVTVSTYSGTITIKYPTETDKQNWSGILGGIKFNFREGIKTSTVQMTVLKNNY